MVNPNSDLFVCFGLNIALIFPRREDSRCIIFPRKFKGYNNPKYESQTWRDGIRLIDAGMKNVSHFQGDHCKLTSYSKP